jgi:D-alanyl-D-alanine carboxypeptidase
VNSLKGTGLNPAVFQSANKNDSMEQAKNVFASRTGRFLIILFIFFSFTSCKDTDTDLIPTDRSRIIAIMQGTRAAMKAPGWIVGIRAPAGVHEYSGGKACRDGDVRMETTDLIRIGSITKTFTATLVLILCDEGVLNLDEKLSNYYPAFPGAGMITIRHLLSHTSGIPTWDEDEEIRMQIYNGTGNWTIDKLIDWAAQQSLLSEPGEGFHYSNIGYFLLGKIMEAKTLKSIDELLQEKICQPLGFTHTFMPGSPDPAGDVIHGYDESGGSVEDMSGTPQADAINFELAWTAGGMMTNIDELSQWARALAGGQLLSDSMYMAQMPVLHPPTPEVPYYTGYGMGVSQTDVWIGHTGAICGFVCYMQYYPEGDVSIITFFNKFSAFDIEANAADLKATGENFKTLATYMCPNTLQPEP